MAVAQMLAPENEMISLEERDRFLIIRCADVGNRTHMQENKSQIAELNQYWHVIFYSFYSFSSLASSMGPIRTEKSGGSSSGPTRKPKTKRKHPHRDTTDSSSLPGVQKLKSSLRQTRRLLAKVRLLLHFSSHVCHWYLSHKGRPRCRCPSRDRTKAKSSRSWYCAGRIGKEGAEYVREIS